MALRNQPYLPLFVKDFLTDEKLIECSAEATGVYIRLMCIMHNSYSYGQLKLSDKYNDTDTIKNYANMLSKQMPYSYEVIYRSLNELLQENVIFLVKNIITQKRMFNDGLLSQKRANAGKMGGKHPKQNESKIQSKIASKTKATTEYEYEVDNEDNIVTYYSNNIHTITPIEYEKLIKWEETFNKDMIKYAIELAVKANARSYNYIEAIFKSWKTKGYKTIIDIELLDKKKNKKEDTPSWFNEEIKRDEPEISEEKRKEIDDFVREFEEQEAS